MTEIPNEPLVSPDTDLKGGLNVKVKVTFFQQNHKNWLRKRSKRILYP